MIEQCSIDQKIYDNECEYSEDRESRICKEKERLLNTDNPEFEEFFVTAIHNINTIPGGEELLKELVKEYTSVSADSAYDAMTAIFEHYADWLASSIVDDEIEKGSQGDTITFVRLAG